MWSCEGIVWRDWFKLFVENEKCLQFLLFSFITLIIIQTLHGSLTKIVFTFFLYLSSLYSLYLCLSFSLNFFPSFSVRLFWKRCQHCCFYTKRLLLSDGWRQPQLQRRACVCLAAEGRSHWKGQNWEALLVTAMKTLTSTNRITISNNCTQFILSDLW